jgi:hypothetical protein
MRTGNPPDELEKVLVIFRVLRAGYRVVLLRLDISRSVSGVVESCEVCFMMDFECISFLILSQPPTRLRL